MSLWYTRKNHVTTPSLGPESEQRNPPTFDLRGLELAWHSPSQFCFQNVWRWRCRTVRDRWFWRVYDVPYAGGKRPQGRFYGNQRSPHQGMVLRPGVGIICPTFDHRFIQGECNHFSSAFFSRPGLQLLRSNSFSRFLDNRGKIQLQTYKKTRLNLRLSTSPRRRPVSTGMLNVILPPPTFSREKRWKS